jgi:hypothetical protein
MGLSLFSDGPGFIPTGFSDPDMPVRAASRLVTVRTVC